MTTKLEKDLKREVSIDGKAYTVTISPVGIKLTEKGRRNGQELTWKTMLNGAATTSLGSIASTAES